MAAIIIARSFLFIDKSVSYSESGLIHPDDDLIGDHSRERDGNTPPTGIQEATVFHSGKQGRITTLFQEGTHKAGFFFCPDKNALLTDEVADVFRGGQTELC